MAIWIARDIRELRRVPGSGLSRLFRWRLTGLVLVGLYVSAAVLRLRVPFSLLGEKAALLWWVILTGLVLSMGTMIVLITSLAIGARRRHPGLVPGADALAITGRAGNRTGGA